MAERGGRELGIPSFLLFAVVLALIHLQPQKETFDLDNVGIMATETPTATPEITGTPVFLPLDEQ